MAISHELSGEIAAALFVARERSSGELNDLKDTLFEIHSTLEQLNNDARRARVERRSVRAAAEEQAKAVDVELSNRAKAAGS